MEILLGPNVISGGREARHERKQCELYERMASKRADKFP
jgi:hypothetical protein